MKYGDIAEGTSEPFFVLLSQQIENADLTLDDIHMSLELLKHCSVCLKKFDARLERPFCLATVLKMDIPIGDHELIDYINGYIWLSATYHSAHFRLLPLSNTAFSAITPSIVSAEGVLSIPFTVS